MNTVTESFVRPRLMGNATYVRAYVRIPIGPLSVPRSTLLQMRRVRRHTQRKTLEDPEVPPFKTFKGGGKFGSNDIPLVNGGSSEDLLNIHMEIHMPRAKRASQRRCQLIRKKIRTYVRTYVRIWSWFSDSTYTRPRDGFWKGGLLTKGQHVGWEGLKLGKSGASPQKQFSTTGWCAGWQTASRSMSNEIHNHAPDGCAMCTS